MKIKPMIRFRSTFFIERLLLFVERASTIYHRRGEHVGKMFSRQLQGNLRIIALRSGTFSVSPLAVGFSTPIFSENDNAR